LAGVLLDWRQDQRELKTACTRERFIVRKCDLIDIENFATWLELYHITDD
jgi:hypothetical protein